MTLDGGRVLCVDNERDIRTVLEDLLTSEAYSVRTAWNGEAALTLLDGPGNWQPDVILLDLELPIMDGYAFERAYRERSPRAPIIVVMAGLHPGAAAKRMGAAAVIAKPFDLDDVLTAVRRHC